MDSSFNINNFFLPIKDQTWNCPSDLKKLLLDIPKVIIERQFNCVGDWDACCFLKNPEVRSWLINKAITRKMFGSCALGTTEQAHYNQHHD